MQLAVPEQDVLLLSGHNFNTVAILVVQLAGQMGRFNYLIKFIFKI